MAIIRRRPNGSSETRLDRGATQELVRLTGVPGLFLGGVSLAPEDTSRNIGAYSAESRPELSPRKGLPVPGFTEGQEAALKQAFARTISRDRLRRAWAFERQRQAFEAGGDDSAEPESSVGDAPYRHRSEDPDPDAEIEHLIAEVRAELDDRAGEPPPGRSPRRP